MFVTGEMPDAIVEKKGLKQSNDIGEIEALCREAIAGNAKAVGQYKEGNTKALNALKGPVMKATKGQANPAVLDAGGDTEWSHALDRSGGALLEQRKAAYAAHGLDPEALALGAASGNDDGVRVAHGKGDELSLIHI